MAAGTKAVGQRGRVIQQVLKIKRGCCVLYRGYESGPAALLRTRSASVKVVGFAAAAAAAKRGEATRSAGVPWPTG
eukprot:6694466-Pyramimonas_sp.AAC.1